MIPVGLRIEDFPPPRSEIRASWAPVYFEPIMGSGERFGVGIAVVGELDFVVLTAPGLSKLDLLYGSSGSDVVFMVNAALEGLSSDLAERGVAALTAPRPGAAGLHIGPVRDGAGPTLIAIAEEWLPLFSSFTADAVVLDAQKADRVLGEGTMALLQKMVGEPRSGWLREQAATAPIPTVARDHIPGTLRKIAP